MSRTTRKRRARKAKTAPPPEALQAGPIENGNTTLSTCQGCKALFPEQILSSRGYCPDCVCLMSVDEDHPGGLTAYQREEMYQPERWGDSWLCMATKKVAVGGSPGAPTHYLNMTPKRLRDILGPQDEDDRESGYPAGTHRDVQPTLREQFTGATITKHIQRHFTDKESEAVNMFLDRGIGPRKISRELGITHRAVIKRLQSALGKIHGKGSELGMSDKQLEAVEHAIVATL